MVKRLWHILHFRILLLLATIMCTILRHTAKAFTRHVAVRGALGCSSSSIIPTTTLLVGDCGLITRRCGHRRRRRRRRQVSTTAFLSSPSDRIPRTTNINSQQQSVPSSSSSLEVDDEEIQINNNESKGTSPPAPNDYDLYRPYFPIYYNDVYEVNLPPGHRFPMGKYRQVREIVQAKVLEFSDEERKLVQSEFRVSPLATMADLAITHSPSYIDRYLNGNLTDQELRNVGFPWSKQGVNRTLSSIGGTVAAATAICDLRRLQIKAKRGCSEDTDSKREIDSGGSISNREENNTKVTNTLPPQSSSSPPQAQLWSAHLAGGTHHAFHSRGEGFCIFSDIAVAANVLLLHYPDLIRKILILDLDVHQGNGNAVLFEGQDDVFTFSMQCRENYFSKREVGDLDIDLPAGCDDATYLSTLNHWLKRIAGESGSSRRHDDDDYDDDDGQDYNDDADGKRPPFDFIFYQAGVDILEDDRLGRMALTREGVRRRNEMVFRFASKMETPLCITMGGGYPRDDDDWTPILNAHSDVYLQALRFLGRQGPKSS